MEETTRKVSKSEVMHQKEKKVMTLENITLWIFSIMQAQYLLTFYFHYKDMPKETMFEGNIVERIKLRKEGFNEIKRKEQNINNELFKAYFTDYQSPSSMYKKSSETENTKINKTRADLIKKVLTKLKRII